MLKKYFKKFLVVAISVIMIVPFVNLKIKRANASVENFFLAVDYTIDIEENGLRDAGATDIAIKMDYNDNETIIYENGADATDDDYVVSYKKGSSEDEKNSTITLKVNKGLGSHKVTVYLVNDESVRFRKNFKITNDYSKLKLKYKIDNDKIDAYQEEVNKNSVDKNLKVGEDSFTVPSIENLLICDVNIPYSSIKKTAYYCVKDSSYSSTSTYTSLSARFSINTYGTYIFYVLAQIDYSDMQGDHSVSITTKGLKELEDGFYQCYDTNGDEIYLNNDKFYVDKDFNLESTELEDESMRELIVPIFKFTLENKGPNIVVSSNYQENGYLDSKYTVSGVSVYGDDVQTVYTLEYAKDGNSTFATASEKLDTTNLTFTPENKGVYRVKVDVYDAAGNTATKYTSVIEVKDKFVSVKYVTSFKDWLSVNKLPFVLLCISGACLIAIVLLLVIKPKEKTVIGEEEDK